jgi:hypothetical protein
MLPTIKDATDCLRIPNLHRCHYVEIDDKKSSPAHAEFGRKWDDHINHYGALRMICKLKHFADYTLRKHMVDSLIL